MLTLQAMKTLYFDCFSGISGDMTIGALLDLGLDFDYLRTELQKLPVDGYDLKDSRVTRKERCIPSRPRMWSSTKSAQSIRLSIRSALRLASMRLALSGSCARPS